METDYFVIEAGVLPRDTLATYLFIICLYYELRKSIDDIVLLANAPTQAETLLHNLKQADAGIGLHANAHKTEYISALIKQPSSTQNSNSLKLVDKLTYLESSVSSTEIDINTRLTKSLTAIDRLSVIWKSDLTDKMKRCFF